MWLIQLLRALIVLWFKTGNDDPKRDSFVEYYTPLVEIKDWNVLVDNTPFSDQPVKNKQEAYEKHVKMSRNSIIQQNFY